MKKAAISILLICTFVMGIIPSFIPAMAIPAIALPFLIIIFFSDKDNKFILLLLFIVLLLFPSMRFPFVKSGGFYLFPPLILTQLLFFKLLLQSKLTIKRLNFIDLLFFIYFITSIISVFHSVINVNWGIKFLYINLFAGYLFRFNLLQLYSYFPNLHMWLLRNVNRLVLLIAASCLLEFLIGKNVYFDYLGALVDQFQVITFEDAFRARGFSEHPLTASMLFLTFMPYNLANIYNNHKRGLSLLATLLLFLGIISTGSRAALIILVAGLFLFFVFFIFYRLANFLFTLSAVAIASVLVVVAITMHEYLYRVIRLFSVGFAEADPNRYYGLLWAIDTFKHYWLWGVGPYNALNFKMTFANSMYDMTPDWSKWGIENSWMTILLEHGIIGFTVFLALSGYIVIKLMFAVKRASNRPQKAIGISILVSFLCFLADIAAFNALDGSFTHTVLLWFFISLCELFWLSCPNRTKAAPSLNNGDYQYALAKTRKHA